MKISRRFDEGKSTKKSFKILDMALKKLYRTTLKGSTIRTVVFPGVVVVAEFGSCGFTESTKVAMLESIKLLGF